MATPCETMPQDAVHMFADWTASSEALWHSTFSSSDIFQPILRVHQHNPVLISKVSDSSRHKRIDRNQLDFSANTCLIGYLYCVLRELFNLHGMLRDLIYSVCLICLTNYNYETGPFPKFRQQLHFCPTVCLSISHLFAILFLRSDHCLAFAHSRMAQNQDMSPPAFVPARDTRPSQEQQITSQGLHPIYDFRQGVRVLSRTAPTAWLDQDSSGDYEPEDHEPNLSDVPRRRVRKRFRRSHSMEPSSENVRNKRKTPSRKRRGRSGHGLPVASKSSEAGRDQLELSETYDSWPFDPVIASNLHWPRSNSNAGSLTHKSSIFPKLVLRPKDPATTLTKRKRGDTEALRPRRHTHHPDSPESDEIQSTKLGIGANLQQEISHQVVPTNTPHGVIHTIVTCFAHPISFNFEPTMESGPPACHWCDDLRYGLLGLGPIETEVIDYRDGRGYMEIANGHTGAGYLPSRMCTGCTLDRLMIAACIPHQVEPLPGVNPDSYVFNSFRHYLVPGMTSSAPFEWCSICPTPASYYCCKRQEPDLSSDDTTEPPEARIGCGLLLCESCAGGLMAQYDGVLEHHIDALKLEGERFVMRADADFLHPKGEVLRRFQQS